MREDGDGRYCERCQLRVTEVARLDGEGVGELLAAAERGRVCARFELEGGRPRTRLGLAAGLLVATVSGCATSQAVTVTRPDASGEAREWTAVVDLPPSASSSHVTGVMIMASDYYRPPTADFVSAPAFDE